MKKSIYPQKIKEIIAIISLLLSLFCVSSGYCYKADYSPYAQGEELPLCESHELVISTPTGADDPMSPRTYEVMDHGKVVSIGIFYDENQVYSADVLWGKGESKLLPAFVIGGTPFTFVGVYWAYLNDDDRKDFIIMNGVDGGGLGASSGYISFILSTPTGYKMRQSQTWEPRQSELVKVGGQCQYLLTTFAEGLLSKDGRQHNYWLYNLFSFQDDEFVLANHLDARFPKWVLYTWQPNHVETSYITRQQKDAFFEEMWVTEMLESLSPE